ncbi:MAG: class I SAM-dependent methyltransferase [Candidatus Woesearchaeota archaeon]
MMGAAYSLIKKYRRRVVSRLLDKNSKTLLDIGCEDLTFYNKLKDKYKITLADLSPRNKKIRKEDIQKLSFKNNSFDIVLCQEVLEHVPNPVKAMKELKRVAKSQLIITIPNEPYFTLFRFLNWDKGHLWAIRPEALKACFGEPSYESKMFCKRYYVGIWNFNRKEVGKKQ